MIRLANIGATISVVLLVLGFSGCGNREVENEQSEAASMMKEATSLAGSEMSPERSIDQLAFELSWDLPFPAPVHMSWISENLPDVVFFQLKSREIHALDVMSGDTRFVTLPLPGLLKLPTHVVSQEIVDNETKELRVDERMYLVVRAEMFCIDASATGEGGQIIWRKQLDFVPASGPYAVGSGESLRVYTGDWTGRLQVITYDEEAGKAYREWQWNTQGIPVAQPNGVEDEIYVGDLNGKLRCFRLDRSMKWPYDARGDIYSRPEIRDKSLYLAGSDNVLHALDRLTGKEAGSLYLGAPMTRQPFYFHGEPKRLYVWTDGSKGGLHAVYTEPDKILLEELSDGKDKFILPERMEKEWFVPGIRSLVASSPSHLFCLKHKSPMIYAINRKNGKIDWRWNPEKTRNEPIFHFTEYVDRRDLNKSIFTVNKEGHVVCYRLFGQLKD